MFWRNDSNAELGEAVAEALATMLPKLEAELRTKLRAELEAELRTEHAAAFRRETARVDAFLSDLRLRLDTDPEARTQLLLSTLGDDLRRQVDGVEQTLANLRLRLDDLTKLEREAVAIIEALESRSGTQTIRSAPERVELGDIRQAKRFGIVSIWFDGGGNDVVELRVGFEPPPEHVVGKVNTRNKLNSSFTTVVRPGEWWTTTTEGSEWGSGVKITLTEFM
jgi:hypothetical protein